MRQLRIIILSGMVVIGVSVFFENCTDATAAVSVKDKMELRFQLGRRLFYDTRLSANNTRSCGSCHAQEFAFTDGYKRSSGLYADLHQRNSVSLVNVADRKYLTAGDSTVHSVYDQMTNPLFNKYPQEMGCKGNETFILSRIKSDSLYAQKFADAQLAITWPSLRSCITAFVSGIQSRASKYDAVKSGTAVFTADESAGEKLFFSDRLSCARCHAGKDFNAGEIKYANTALYNIDKAGGYPADDQGLYTVTRLGADNGKFLVPSLRNLAFTQPYYHDGSESSLSVVIDNYARGGRLTERGSKKGDGKLNANKHLLITGFSISENEKLQLLKFLMTLSDSSVLSNTRFRNPFAEINQ